MSGEALRDAAQGGDEPSLQRLLAAGVSEETLNEKNGVSELLGDALFSSCSLHLFLPLVLL